MYTQLALLFALIFTGMVLAKIGFLNDTVTLGINKMIVYFAFPCLITYKLGTMTMTPSLLRDFVVVMVLATVSFVIFTVIVRGYFKIRGLTDKMSAPAMLCTTIPNNGFIGYPVALVFLGTNGLLLMIAHGAIAFNLYVYTYAISYLRKSKKDAYQPPMTAGRVMGLVVKLLINPNIIAVVLGLLIFALGISLDNIVGNYLSMIGDMASPLVMIYIGAMIADTDFVATLKTPLLWEASFVKLIILPAAFFLLTYWLPISDISKAILVLGTAFPAAAIPIMLGQQLDLDTDQAGKVFFLSTLLSMATLPAVMHILSTVLNL